jgi:hypothetical protein
MLIQENGLKGAPLWVEDPREEGAGPYRTNEAPVVTKEKTRRGENLTVGVRALPAGRTVVTTPVSSFP